MKRRKGKKSIQRQAIPIRRLTTFSEVYSIKSIIDRHYDGVMPKDAYDGLLSMIIDKDIRRYFISFFKFQKIEIRDNIDNSVLQGKSIKRQKPKKDKDKKIIQVTEVERPKKTVTKLEKESGKDKECKSPKIGKLYKVRAKDFRFKFTGVNPRLIWGKRERFFLGRVEWFVPEVLNSIDRTFTIRKRRDEEFVFDPFDDQKVFRKLLEEKYEEFKTLKREKILKECDDIVSRYYEGKVNSFFSQFRSFSISVPLTDFSHNKEREVYSLHFNCLEHLQLNSELKYRVSITYSSIEKLFEGKILHDYEEEIKKKWGEGCSDIYTLKEILPGIKSPFATIKIPSIYIERNRASETLELMIDYVSQEGLFRGHLHSRYASRYMTEMLPVVFPDYVRESLRRKIALVDTPFIETFYTAFTFMFDEGDWNIRQRRDRIMRNQDEDSCYFTPEYQRYQSGLSPLLPFDKENKNDWMWLTSMLQKGVFDAAYCFRDKDETYSSKMGDTKKYNVKIYITVEKEKRKKFRSNEWIIVPNSYTLSLYALDTEKSIYRFKVEGSNLYEAIFFLWSYFSSNNYNKRQDFYSVLVHKYLFGINDFYKANPLVYKKGIGYCDAKWSE